jgi:peptidoglycan-N-acetylmuramic acid deacetylase
MVKRITSTIIIIALYVRFSSGIYASCDARSWYVNRSGNKRPELPAEHKIIEKYNGFYIDKHLDDESKVKKIYITFDAGYENGNVELILNTLKEKNVPAAFFILDHIILKNTDLVKRMANKGHFVCNHTKNHRDLTKLSREEIIKDVNTLEEIYFKKTGYAMAKYFRFPEGKYNEQALSVISDMGYKTVFWSFGYADWDNNKQPDAAYATEKILSNTHNGEIILLHPTSSTNARILPMLIDKWRDMGYSFGTLDELCN